MNQIQNLNPKIFKSRAASKLNPVDLDYIDLDSREEWSREEIFDLIRGINDPEHPLTLEQLNVAQLTNIRVCDSENTVTIHFTPTIPHCSMATLIGLTIRVRLLRSLPERFKVDIMIEPGTHQSEESINKQLNDKERVAAALENDSLLKVVNQCLLPTLTKESLFI